MHTENFVRTDNAYVTTVCEIIIALKMSPVFIALVALVGSTFQASAAKQAEIAALRHQIAVLQRSAPRRLRLKQSDRMLWILLSWLCPDWRHWLHILQPDTVVRWHRSGFARYWTWKSRRRPGKTACGLSDWRLDSTNVPTQLLVGSQPRNCDSKLTLFKSWALLVLVRFATAA